MVDNKLTCATQKQKQKHPKQAHRRSTSPQPEGRSKYSPLSTRECYILTSFAPNVLSVCFLAGAPLLQEIVVLICMLASWLHLTCGLSRDAASRVLKFLFLIVRLSVRAGALLSKDMETLNAFHMPLFVNSAIAQLGLEPDLIRSICCPKCFTLYSLTDCPEICPRRETPKSWPCNASLWATRHRGGHAPRRVPARLYTTQSFESWLTWFLGRPGIEDLLDTSYIARGAGPTMHDIYDSPAWKSLGDFCTTRRNLTFSFYIDWFNPFTNRIAGKKVSCGAIMMVCLNLPPELRYRPENMFFAGLTPPPHEPDVVTITNVLEPVISQVAPLQTGRVFRTYRYPAGKSYCVAVLPLLGDLVAIRKAGGFSAHSANLFCSFCDLTMDKIDCLDHEGWKLRDGAQVRANGFDWLAATTKVKREEIRKKTGNRFSALHRLLYRDPVRHTVLGPMHNWLEGILQDYVRWVLGIGGFYDEPDEEDQMPEESVPEGTAPGEAVFGEAVPAEDQMVIDSSEIDEEIAALVNESAHHQDAPSHQKRQHSRTPSAASDDSEGTLHLQPDAESESDGGEYREPAAGKGVPSEFSPAQLELLRVGLADVILPSHIERPPTNLGMKQHGKLKADNWLVLFTIMFPMILLRMWDSSGNTRHRQLLENLHHLVLCTNIVCAFSTSDEAADEFDRHYVLFRKGMRKLFPHAHSKPNHHYAMHYGWLLKFWGPLMALSEFPYERVNGILQKIKTNNHLCKHRSVTSLSLD
jgi:hypothetical protein